MTEWDLEEWTDSVKRVLDWVDTVNSEQPLMLIFRHSHREVMHTHEAVMEQGLTELGKKMSIELGKRIPAVRDAEIYYSFILRCYETAEGISNGFESVGGNVRIMDPERTLMGPNTIDSEVWKELSPDGQNVTDFVNRWSDGEFENRLESFNEFGGALIKHTLKRLLATEDNSVHIHVTHDLSQMCTLRILFDRPLVEKDREPFLGGVGATIEDGRPILFVKGEFYPIDGIE